MRAYVFLAEGFEEIEAMSAMDILRRAEIETLSVSTSGALAIRGAHGIEAVADIHFEECLLSPGDVIVLPGGMPGAKNLAAHDGLSEKLFAHNKIGGLIAAICAAPSLVLGRKGLLEGRRATCYPGMEKNLGEAFMPGEKLVCDGNIITASGPADAMDFALAIVERVKGKPAADSLAKDLLRKH